MKKKKLDKNNEFWEKRRLLFWVYRKILAVSFIAYLLTSILYDIWETKFFFGLMIIPLGVFSYSLVALLPMTLYVRYLKLKAIDEDNKGDDAVFYDRAKEKAQRAIYDVDKQKIPWLMIFMFMVIFPPVAFLFMIFKLTTEPFYSLENSRTCKSFGYTVTILGAAITYFFIHVSSTTEALNTFDPFTMVFISLMLSGVLAIAASFYLDRKGRRFNTIQKQILIDGIVGIDELAQSHKMNYGEMIRTLDYMISNKLLYKSYIDFPKREIKSPVDLPKMAVRCPRCTGTTIMIKGFPWSCEYCGKVFR